MRSSASSTASSMASSMRRNAATDLGRETRQRILTAEADQVNALAQIGGERQVIAPRAIDLSKRHRPLGAPDGVLAGRRRPARACARARRSRPPELLDRAGSPAAASMTWRRCSSMTDA